MAARHYYYAYERTDGEVCYLPKLLHEGIQRLGAAQPVEAQPQAHDQRHDRPRHEQGEEQQHADAQGKPGQHRVTRPPREAGAPLRAAPSARTVSR